ncbi:hypothetical protein OSB04_003112 [Centaurea solstitialis]|uniref:Integrase catalytic domain-containing protein n=1 Tax=Centaurea solstitialis TaxID=347529 RepID=A0AA38U4P4_9ASTR|nr:hypothetical protein OSB04_003112 [Centaurea solstitialis]
MSTACRLAARAKEDLNLLDPLISGTRVHKKTFQKAGQGDIKRNEKCHVCGETWHYARECKMRKSKTSETTSAVVEIKDLVANLSLEEIKMLVVNGSMVLAARGSWYFDTGATVHVCDSRDKFVEYHEVHDGKQVIVANRNRVDVVGIGTVQLHFTSGNILTLLNVLHVPTIAKCLVSYNKLDVNGFGIQGGDGVIVFVKDDRFVGRAYRDRGMYRLSVKDHVDDTDSDSDDNVNEVSDDESDDESIGSNAMVVDEVASGTDGISDSLCFPVDAFEFENGLIEIDNKVLDKCETCVKSKFIKKLFPSVKRDTSVLELIHFDICELNGVLTRGGKRYFITFCDDFGRFLHVYLLHSKVEAFITYKAEVENQKEKRIKILRSDKGGKYFSREFDTFCEENGIKHERTSLFTREQNDLVERKNQTLVEMVNCMLNQSRLPTNMWGEALMTACHIHNRITSRVIQTCHMNYGKKENQI